MLLKQATVLVCLGATAAGAIISPKFRLTTHRGHFYQTDMCSQTIATWHPSALLRTPDEKQRLEKRRQMIADVAAAAKCSLSSDPN